MAGKINVLMCGGRRTGKTSIMAAMQRDMQELFASGNIVLRMENSSSLVLYQQAQEQLFSEENLDKMSYYAMDNPTSRREDYGCKVTLRGDYRSPVELNFIDVPGEWFVDVKHEEELQTLIKESQILVIAVDSPHLLEKDGRYHEVFNRPTEITDAVKKAYQGSRVYRLIMFVPVKCELYQNETTKSKNMRYLLQAVQDGYQDLITYLITSQKDYCTVSISPCITMGGLEFLQFVAPLDDEGNLIKDDLGNPLPDIMLNQETGCLDMTWHSEYTYLYDENGDHYYKPENCAQPLLNILLFFVAMGKLRTQNKNIILILLGKLLLHLPDQKVLDGCRQDLLQAVKTEAAEGYAVLNDPLFMLKG